MAEPEVVVVVKTESVAAETEEPTIFDKPADEWTIANMREMIDLDPFRTLQTISKSYHKIHADRMIEFLRMTNRALLRAEVANTVVTEGAIAIDVLAAHKTNLNFDTGDFVNDLEHYIGATFGDETASADRVKRRLAFLREVRRVEL